MRPDGAYDDDELAISLAPSANRRAQNKAPDRASSTPQQHQRQVEPKTTQKTDRIGSYIIKRTLGEGSFGKVKLAVHRHTGQEVALKIIARRKLISRDMAGRVEREIEYLQLLRHPHIIKLYTVIKTEQDIYMVLEYAGGELFDYIVQNGKMREDEARRFFQQIICAVEYCHRHKIVHRDLKPENLLLDEDLNVKIADFGLSNIMTDGNFLKTSCGSPNYAAPEVINGKLYAGPEVDVWSCGVILYVLLVGRLPFDDEHIPTLFTKISKGKYLVPNFMSDGAANVIARCLATNPVHRATIEEIRQDPWFTENLPSYLHPPVEEFIDTGVDLNKAISPSAIAPGATPAIQERMHDAVVEKIGKTMGYGKQDVQEALRNDEPSAIKDAYLIVRENKLMQTNPLLSDFKGEKPFTSMSPPAYSSSDDDDDDDEDLVPYTPTAAQVSRGYPPTVMAGDIEVPNMPLTAAERFKLEQLGDLALSPASVSTDRTGAVRPYISKIGVLPTSLPHIHRSYMEARKSGKADEFCPRPVTADHDDPHPQSEADQAETARRLKPHSRSQLKLLDEGSKKPAGMTPVNNGGKKAKQTKWQFGIRSRNQPLEAIGCIYRALHKLGAEWVIDGDWERESDHPNTGEDVNDDNDDAIDGGPLRHVESNRSRAERSVKFIGRDRTAGKRYILPTDPWVLRVRWKKDGMYPPGVYPPSASTHDLRRTSITSLHSSTLSTAPASASTSQHSLGAAAAPPPTADPPPTHAAPRASESVVMHLDIQLYEMEPGVYLVDFKAAGYENEEGGMLEEKDVTSPFPFLDLASRLIIQLAEAD